MRLALFGYGAMNQLVAARALADGHQIAHTFMSRDAERAAREIAGALRGADVAIDFSVGSGVLSHAESCALAGVPLVVGTTGWQADMDTAHQIIAREKSALIYGANFSIGVNLFYRIVASAAELMKDAPDYAPFLEEAHHARKKDAPSGTALKLQDILRAGTGRDIPVSSTRAGHIPGTHRVGFDSPADQITLTHTARNREGFAAGALLAAHWIQGREGVYEFSEWMDDILRNSLNPEHLKETDGGGML
ncbi:MAG TPA: dihydrodipicolinate reductase C-terminal domain-containing protein [Pyrinomonadaceae bacterium]|nr:dihydrodipicolinate reductase C-terminal domain-containing protein [Pyrinomonadaceae bacterium]